MDMTDRNRLFQQGSELLNSIMPAEPSCWISAFPPHVVKEPSKPFVWIQEGKESDKFWQTLLLQNNCALVWNPSQLLLCRHGNRHTHHWHIYFWNGHKAASPFQSDGTLRDEPIILHPNEMGSVSHRVLMGTQYPWVVSHLQAYRTLAASSLCWNVSWLLSPNSHFLIQSIAWK